MSCSTCRTRRHCLPCGFDGFATSLFEHLGLARRKVPDRLVLYGAGDAFTHVFAVRSGTLKSTVLSNGREQISGFHVAGDVVGLDAIADGRHASTVTALEDSEVCAIPYAGITDLAASTPQVQDVIGRLMGGEILREYQLLLLLGSMSAEERLAAFLLDLSLRYAIRGYSPVTFHLRMGRADIGRHLGLQVETVCRAFTALQRQRLIRSDRRVVHITDLEGLRRHTDTAPRVAASRHRPPVSQPRPQLFPLDLVSR